MEVWTSLWIAVWYIACRTVDLWIWMYTTWQNGAVWQNWVSFLWITIVLLWNSLILPVANGML